MSLYNTVKRFSLPIVILLVVVLIVSIFFILPLCDDTKRKTGASRVLEPSPLPSLTEQIEPGLTLKFETLQKGATSKSGFSSDVRTARLISLYVPNGMPPTPFLAPGTFRATWEGNIHLDLREEYTFSLTGRGTFSLTINGEPALRVTGEDLGLTHSKPIRLNSGENHLVARYESPEKGDAILLSNNHRPGNDALW